MDGKKPTVNESRTFDLIAMLVPLLQPAFLIQTGSFRAVSQADGSVVEAGELAEPRSADTRRITRPRLPAGDVSEVGSSGEGAV